MGFAGRRAHATRPSSQPDPGRSCMGRNVLSATACSRHNWSSASATFLLPCHGVPAPRNIFLHIYAGHLVRAADGQWSVFADYTQGLAGAGLALENRIVISRILPADFHSLHVERLAGFFITLRDTLQSLSPQHGDNPRVVLLSSGPRSPGYFEDAYLARYLGYTLVEGGDLTVRGTNVCLKTLGGLLPVDVILRRTPDEESDPLELQADSLHGVTGLVEAARSGQVVVANALGSGLLESPALMAFLPAICRSRLGEDLKLRSAPTWWCGRDDDWSYVESHFERADDSAHDARRGANLPVDTALLDSGQRERLAASGPPSIARPTWRSAASTARPRPSSCNGRMEAWPIGLRIFVAADRDGAYQVMPGGLARALPPAHAQAPIRALRRGARRAAGRRPRQGCLDPVRPPCLDCHAPPPAGGRRRTPPQHLRFAQPRGRQSLLARPPRRAGRRPGAASPHGRPSHDQRIGAVESARTQDPRADAGRRRPARGRVAERAGRTRVRRWKRKSSRRSPRVGARSRAAARSTKRSARSIAPRPWSATASPSTPGESSINSTRSTRASIRRQEESRRVAPPGRYCSPCSIRSSTCSLPSAA